jgi:glycosyltransferase involved in cell wall biosynthesis
VPSLARWRLYGQQHPRPVLRALLLSVIEVAEQVLGKPAATQVDRKREFFQAQTQRIMRDVNLFLAPSKFLLMRFLSCGVPPEKIVYMRNGMRLHTVVQRKEQQPRIHFGYIGALHPQKGIELLLDAFDGMDDRASLEIFGSTFGSPVSENHSRRLMAKRSANVHFRGPYQNSQIGTILANLDIVVVPSLWYENSPLTIQEAFISGVPVITADVGGMAELVQDGVNGLHFRFGDAVDLRDKMQHVVDHPEVLVQLRRGIPPVPGIVQHAEELRLRYASLLESSNAG